MLLQDKCTALSNQYNDKLKKEEDLIHENNILKQKLKSV